ncbi:high choriolytic enzyme 1-like isoform X2 [Melanotaenia boesemani]|nr:high choriolytic enzyme 1-like isoform X2 [Melanotaenia boesemani]
MTPAFFFLLFLSMAAASLGALNDTGNPIKESKDVSKIIARANVNTNPSLIHGDIMPTRSRNAVPCTAAGCTWPKTGANVFVPVSFSPAYSPADRDIINKTLMTFHKSTCIRFVQKAASHSDYLYFFSGNGCWSYLGRQGGNQSVSLRKNGCLYQSTVQHEVLHALGFHHEQVRSDRDQYIQILPQNIEPGQEPNFEKVKTNNLRTPYDFNSVMHYDKYAFSKNGQPTIVAKSNPNLNFGTARQMSANDIARVNRLYGC